jgi:hypothetical protein
VEIYSTHSGDEKILQYFGRKSRRDHSGSLVCGERSVDIKKRNVRVWTVLKWLRTGVRNRLL